MNKGFPAACVNLDSLARGPIEWAGELPDAPKAWGLDGLDLAGAPRLEYRAEPGGHGGVRVVGRLRASLNLECRRCLADIRWPVDIEIDFRFDPSVRPWEEEAGVFTLDPDAATLDLTRPLREELALCVPEYLVCGEDCRGLCPVCGANRNGPDCGCRSETADPRWEVLRQLESDLQHDVAGPEPNEEEDNGA